MPAKTSKSSLAARLGSKLSEAHEAHKDDETTFSGGASLPDGIENGIAQLVEAKFDVYKSGANAGKDFFYAAGIVMLPEDAGGVPIKGLRTSIMVPACQTKRMDGTVVPFEDNWAKIENELRKLGIPTADLDVDDLLAAVPALKEAKPFFRFRTWKGKATDAFPNPRVNEDWRGVCDYTPDEGDGGGVVDDTPEEEPPKAAPKAAPKAGGKKPPAKPPVEEAAEDDSDLAALAHEADSNDEDAQNKINKLALEAGITQKKINSAENWTAVVALFAPAAEEEAVEEAAEESVEEEEEWKPAEGDVYKYKPMGKKKAIDHEVTAVFESKKTVNLKDLETEKIIKGIGWDKLEQS